MSIQIINLKKIFKFALFITISVLCGFIFFANTVSADDLLNPDVSLQPVQQDKISQIKSNFENQNNMFETKIADYNNKISLVENDENKSEAQKKLLIGAYERNIDTLKLQQKMLKQETESLYKSVMSDEEFAKFKNAQSDI